MNLKLRKKKFRNKWKKKIKKLIKINNFVLIRKEYIKKEQIGLTNLMIN